MDSVSGSVMESYWFGMLTTDLRNAGFEILNIGVSSTGNGMPATLDIKSEGGVQYAVTIESVKVVKPEPKPKSGFFEMIRRLGKEIK